MYLDDALPFSFGGKSPSRRRRPSPQASQASIKGSVEEVPLFADFSINNDKVPTTTDSTTTTTTASPFILTPGEDGVYSQDDVDETLKVDAEEVIDRDQYVQFIASPPKQINIAIPPRGFEHTAEVSTGKHF